MPYKLEVRKNCILEKVWKNSKEMFDFLFMLSFLAYLY